MNTQIELYPDVRATAELLADNGGITVNRHGGVARIERGYAVGGACQPLLLKANAPRATRVEAIGRWIQQTPTNVEYFGAWVADGVLYIDGVDIVSGYTEAVLLGFEREEKAVYDFTNNREEVLREV